MSSTQSKFTRLKHPSRYFFKRPHKSICIKKYRGFLTSIPLSASTSYGTRNLTANSTIRHVVPFSRTAKMALSGLVERPDRFSPSCSASTTDSASTPGDTIQRNIEKLKAWHSCQRNHGFTFTHTYSKHAGSAEIAV